MLHPSRSLQRMCTPALTSQEQAKQSDCRRRCIQRCPINTQLFRRRYKLVIVQRLDYVTVSEVIIGAGPVSFLTRGSENNNRQTPGAFILANRLQNFQPVDFGNVEVEQDKHRQLAWVASRIFTPRKEGVKRLLSIVNTDQRILDLGFLERSHS